MKTGSIFAIHKIGEKLFSIQFEESDSHIFEELFDKWNDVVYLRNFFLGNISNLHRAFWTSIYRREVSIEDAIEITLELSDEMEEYILEHHSSGSNGERLSRIFRPLLNDNVYHKPLSSAFKTNGLSKTGWLRVYAIRIEDNYIITGGAIKLTKTMQESLHTRIELNKLQNVANELKRNHFTENSDFDFVYLEI